MGLPVTGPFVKNFTQNGPPRGVGGDFRPHWVVGTRTWYRQTYPYDRELDFSYKCTRIKSSTGGSDVDYVDAYMHPALRIPSDFRARVYAHAYERFQKKLKKETAELGNLLATRKQALDMITDRATKLWQGFREVRRGNVTRLQALWGKKSGIRKKLRSKSSNVLEYSFGWAPLVKDIHNAIQVFKEGYPSPRILSVTQVPFKYNGGWTDFGAVRYHDSSSGVYECRIRARVRVTDPNALLLNQMGLTNPLTVLLELTPWSFVINYFVNIEDFLRSLTDLVGLELSRHSVTTFAIENGSYQGDWDTLPEPSYNPISHLWERVECTRSPGVPLPSLVVRLPWRLSVQRATTSIALLLQQIEKS